MCFVKRLQRAGPPALPRVAQQVYVSSGRPDLLRTLRRILAPEREVITYCQGGYRAAHSYIALRLLGYPRVRMYIGSWKEWGDRTELPIELPKKN